MFFDFDTEIKRQTGTDGREYKVCNGTFYSAVFDFVKKF